jgi:hypothetical protein
VKIAGIILSSIVLIAAGCQSALPPTPPKSSIDEGGENEFPVIKSAQDIAKLAFVDKQCRVWAADGDIDIDQTCIIARRVQGGFVVIPNEYVDSEMKEVLGNMGKENKDKWLLRFYAVGGGEKRGR